MDKLIEHQFTLSKSLQRLHEASDKINAKLNEGWIQDQTEINKKLKKAGAKLIGTVDQSSTPADRAYAVMDQLTPQIEREMKRLGSVDIYSIPGNKKEFVCVFRYLYYVASNSLAMAYKNIDELIDDTF